LEYLFCGDKKIKGREGLALAWDWNQNVSREGMCRV